MVILGLGSNLSDRLAHLRKAMHALQHIPGLRVLQTSPVYISDAMLPENASAHWNLPYLNLALRCEVACAPIELLEHIKKIELNMGRDIHSEHWSPREIDIDILAWDDLIFSNDKLSIPRSSMLERPFQLWPLADLAPTWVYPLSGHAHGKTAAELVETWGSRFSGRAPFKTRQIYQRIDTPRLVGIVNVTPDSFSDGNLFLNSESALQQALALVRGGAEIIDIGAESTAPNATPLDAETEWSRLESVLNLLRENKNHFLLPPKISVDTRHAIVAEKALQLGADWINDVTGLTDPAMQEVVAQSHAECVVMHHLSIPASRQQVLPRGTDPVKLIYEWGAKHLDQLEKAGIARSRMIFDPGIGFGKVPEHSLMLIKHIQQFAQLDVRLLVGHSRKSFFSLFTDKAFSERDVETMVASLFLARQGVDYLRLHDVEMCARGFRLLHLVMPACF